MNNIKKLYKVIRCWEFRNGESFIEYFGDNFNGIDTNEFMPWMVKKGYINSEKLESYKNDADKWTGVCDCTCAYEVPYSLFPYGECDEDANLKAELIIAEYLFEKKQEHVLYEFAMEGKGWSTIKTEQEKQDYKDSMQEYIDKWDKEDDEEYDRILNLSVDEINARLFEEYEGEE